jgi:hypothetical protein
MVTLVMITHRMLYSLHILQGRQRASLTRCLSLSVSLCLSLSLSLSLSVSLVRTWQTFQLLVGLG